MGAEKKFAVNLDVAGEYDVKDGCQEINYLYYIVHPAFHIVL